MAKIKVLHRRTLSIETASPEDLKEGAALNISLPGITTTTSPESSNTAQPTARAKKTTC